MGFFFLLIVVSNRHFGMVWSWKKNVISVQIEEGLLPPTKKDERFKRPLKFVFFAFLYESLEH